MNKSWILISAFPLIVAACGKGAGNVSISSPAFVPSSSAKTDLAATSATSTSTAPVGVTDFSFCVRDIKLETEDGSAVKNTGQESEDSEDWIKFRIGLISLADGSKSVSWGAAQLPVDKPIKRVKIKIHRDEKLCNVPYSVKINDRTITRDIELHFSFAQPKNLAAGDTITLDVTSIISKLKDAYDRNMFLDDDMDQNMSGVEGDAADH